MKIRTIIVEDEQHCEDRLVHLLQSNHNEIIEIVGIACNVDDGIALFNSAKPQLMFLDVHIKDKLGFDLLQSINWKDIRVIFTTSFEKYALDAFRFSAVDYLVKPIEEELLRIAVSKVQDSLQKTDTQSNLEFLLSNLKAVNSQDKRISIGDSQEIHFVKISDIIRCEADVNYTHFYLSNHSKLTASKPLKEYDELLANSGFFRVHQSHLINLDKIKSYQRGKGGIVVMEDETEVPVSTRKKDEFLAALK